MKCSQCGIEIPEGVKFCPSCGASTSGEGQKPSEAPKAESTKAEPNAAAGSGSTTVAIDPSAAVGFLKKNKKVTIGAAAAVVVVIVAIVAFVMISSNVPEDIVKSDLMETSLVKNGAVPSNYVNDADYSISELKIVKQSDQQLSDTFYSVAAKAAMGSDKVRRVMVSGKIANGNFETSFSGYFDYVKSGDKWVKVDDSVSSDSTKPLKGVDTTVSSSSGSSSSSSASYSDFSSTFEESDGYTSVATQKVKYSYWFADDTATCTSTFKFNSSEGWKRTGQDELSDTNTEWKLKGKTFAKSDSTKDFQGFSYVTIGTTNASITFGDCSGETANATYAVGFNPTTENTSSIEYLAVDLKGSVTGSLIHEFSKSSFKVELNDQGNSVTFSLSGDTNSSTTSAGEGKVNQLSGSAITNSVYQKTKSKDYKLEVKSVYFSEKTTV